MAEDEVLYASVVVKNKRPQKTNKEEEVVYDEVKISNQTAQQTPDTNVSSRLLSDKEAEGKCRWYQKLACGFGILCVILVLAIIGVCVHILFSHKSDEQELKQLKANQMLLLEENHNLTDLNKKVSSDLNITIQNLTQEKENLTRELDEVKNKTQQLQEEKKILTEQIETMEKTWNEQNVSRAQWSVDEYCPKENKRKCSSCQKGWLLSQSSCYAVNNAEPPNQKTWEEAREDCRGKISDLTVVGDEEEKFVKDNSWVNNNIKGYWIGLRAEGGKWRWIDGSDLTNQAWIQQQPVDGQCVTSLQGREWRSESCDEKNTWICEKKALSV
ncbi:C-type lectin domain family 4 member G-like isoform X2 [Fundulus heteroclitus]|uniref:C-type lectin domain family 4 member G-like isoform X2 n=1 Tax=Fundulus heteroclitus TaxID=8078 RepID=UPI00165AE3F2|nr:C-type lectin domain family 4 member G-like isoform X2 [Fundulus heteroclitus]